MGIVTSAKCLKFWTLISLSFSLVVCLVMTHTVFDIIADDEIEFLISEPVVFCEGSIYFVNNGL
jgi:hypothetical protein